MKPICSLTWRPTGLSAKSDIDVITAQARIWIGPIPLNVKRNLRRLAPMARVLRVVQQGLCT